MQDILEKLEELVLAERFEDFEATLADLSTREIQDSHIHLRLADLCDAAGLGDRLVAELNLAFRDAPDNLDILRRLGQVHADAGRSERAIKCWRHITERDPSDLEAWEELGALQASLSRYEEAQETYLRAYERTGQERFQALARALRRVPEPPPETPAGLPDEAVLVRFHTLFSGREGVYARQWVNPRGETGYTPIREPFTLNVARNHLLGNHTVGIYPVRLDNTVTFAAVDFDLNRSLTQRSAPGQPEWEAAFEALRRHARALVARAQEHGIPVYLEDSGGKGLHAWIFFDAPVTARVGRRLLAELLHLVGSPPPGTALECFPKQSSLPTDGLGNLIKLPLGIHRLTGRRAVFLEADGSPAADQEGYLLSISRVARQTVMAFLERRAEAQEDWTQPPPLEEATSTAPAVLPPEYNPEGDLELQVLLSRCPTLRSLVDKVEEQRNLTHDEALVLIHSVGHLTHGPQAANNLLRHCPEVNPATYLKSRLRGNPISCPKIRARIPHITSAVSCNCQFPEQSGLYPNPLLHLQASGGSTAEVGTLQFQALLQDFLRARKALSDAQRLHEKCVARLHAWFDQAGIEEFQTPLGVLKRVRDEQGDTCFQLEV